LPTSPPHKKLPITAPRPAATALACSPTSQLPTVSTHAASVTASHALDRPLSKLLSAPAADYVNTVEFLDAAEFTSAAEFPTVSLCHLGTVSSSLRQSSPKPQLSLARCCASCCVLPHTHAADFYYCHAGCHPVAIVQQCFLSAYTLTDFNPVTPRMKVVKGSEFMNLFVGFKVLLSWRFKSYVKLYIFYIFEFKLNNLIWIFLIYYILDILIEYGLFF